MLNEREMDNLLVEMDALYLLARQEALNALLKRAAKNLLAMLNAAAWNRNAHGEKMCNVYFARVL